MLKRDFLILAACLMACGAPGLAQAQTAQPVNVRVAYVPVIGAAPVFVLAQAGWAKAAGLDLTLTKFESGPPAIGALASGTIDVLAIGIAPIAVARAKGLDVKVVAASANGGSGFVATPKLIEAFDATGQDAARAFALFRQRNGRPAKLATVPAGGVPPVALNNWLFRLNAVAHADVQIVPMGIDAIQQTVLTGGVDGGTVLEPSMSIVLGRDPRLKMLASANQMFDGLPGVVLAVSGPFARQHPDAVEELVRLMRRAHDLILAKPDEAAGLVQPVLGGGLLDNAVLAHALASQAVAFVTDPRQIEASTQRMLAYQVELGVFEKAPSTAGLFDPSFHDRVSGR